MNSLIFLLFVGIHGATAVTHSLKYFYTASSKPKLPRQHQESKSLKQDWMTRVKQISSMERETLGVFQVQQTSKPTLKLQAAAFNQTGGVHVAQKMSGCEWDDETGEVKGYDQHGYDGEDFIVFDLKTKTWIAPTPQALITKLKWDNNKAKIAQDKQYLNQICPEWLKKYVNYGRSSLLRTELPSVSLLQKTPSSPVSCHATGFFPHRAVMFWRKDGEELHEDVDQGEILPNHDETFQMSVDLNISSVTPEDWRRYDCVFQLSGVKEDIVIKLDKTAVETNWGKPGVRGDGGRKHGIVERKKSREPRPCLLMNEQYVFGFIIDLELNLSLFSIPVFDRVKVKET
uniref:Ig-like domain-containing protein n=1 Tax=Seriola dumerili TaxID=41447 RepID=A0A3B4VN25_SERDU